jgi:hypothetical protein
MRQTPQQHALGFELIDLRRSGMTRKPRQVEGAARVGMTLASAISRIRAIAKAFGAQSRPAWELTDERPPRMTTAFHWFPYRRSRVLRDK